jgi:hypothetical protein
VSRTRIAIVVAIVAVLAALLSWQWHRDHEIARCLDEGGRWTGGLRAACVPAPSIILHRDLHRT